MRKVLTVMMGILWILASASPASNEAAAKPNFSGVWNLNLQKSLLQIPAPDSGVFRIVHKEPIFHLSRTFLQAGQEDVWSIDLTTDGQEVVREEQTETFRGRLFWDGQDLILNSTISLKDRTAANTVRYHLSEDGLTLTATESFRGPRLKYDNVWVFDKDKSSGENSGR
jgi:hypothetical protein